MGRIQQNYAINPDVGFNGGLAEPNSPHRIEAGRLHVPAGATRANPRPGDALYYDTGQNAWAVPTDAAQSRIASGILTYRADTVQTADSFVQFSDNDEIFVATMGVYWLVAGGAVERDQLVSWDRASPFDWNVAARAADHASIANVPVFSVNRDAVAASALFKAAIGYGRVI